MALGLVVVDGIQAGPAPESLARELGAWIARRNRDELSPEEDNLRKACRDILRNGSYKPTGRGKPANEYLLRAAKQGDFPSINGPVDANNLVSLQHCVPISLWDLDLAGTHEFEFRLGATEEAYVFNPSGQALGLRDLVCGCRILPSGESVPTVTPIKDSMATKTAQSTTRVAGCIYFPLKAGGESLLRGITEAFLHWLLACGPAARGCTAVCTAGETVQLQVA